MLRGRAPVSLLLAGTLIGALAPSAGAQSLQPGPQGIDWQLVRLAGSGVPFIEVPASVRATLRIDGSAAGGQGGCNRWFSDVAIEGGSIAFGAIGATKMACGEPQMGFEQQYLHFLGEVRRWAIEGGLLQLADASGAVLLELSPQAQGALEGVGWRVRELLVDGSLVTIPTGIDVTMRLDAGQAGGSSGCNRWFSTYALAGDDLTFGGVGGTEMACPEPRMTIEGAWYTALGLTIGWRLVGDQLQLVDATGTPVAVLEVSAPASLVGAWTVAELADATGAVALLGTSDAVLVFGEDGSLGGNTGCNALVSAWTATGSSIDIGPVGTAGKPCPDDPSAALESQLLAALDTAASWRISAEGWLELLDTGGALRVGLTPGTAVSG